MERLSYIVIVAVLAIAGCGDLNIGIDPPIYTPIPPKAPKNVIYNLELSFNKRDINLYKQCLSPNFTFHFHPDEVGLEVNGYVIPETWSYEEDWAAVRKMFGDAYNINMYITENDVGNSNEGVTTYTANHVRMELVVTFDTGFWIKSYRATGTFKFEIYRKNGNVYWRITDWWDEFGMVLKGDSTAPIGMIKAYFVEQ